MLLADLPADVLPLILFWLAHAVQIAKSASVCKAWSAAAKAAFKLRPFSGAARTLLGLNPQPNFVFCVDAAGAYIIAGRCNDNNAIGVQHGVGIDRATGVIDVWQRGALLRGVRCPYAIRALKFLPDGVRFISGADRFVELWNVDGTKEKTMMVGGSVSCLEVMPDGVRFVVGMDRLGQMRVYDMNGTQINAFSVTRDGQHLIAGASKVVKVWGDLDVPQGNIVACKGRAGMPGHQDEVRAIAVTPDGQRILSAGHDNTVRVWLFSGRLENIFSELHTSTVDALVALPDNDHALSGAQNSTIKLFNINDGAVLRTFSMALTYPNRGHLMSLALLPDGRRFVGGHFGSVGTFDHGLWLAPPAPAEANLPRPPPPPADGTTVRVRLPSGTFDRKFAPEATLHTVLCAIHHESGTELLAAKKYHLTEPGPPTIARCTAATPLAATLASLGLTGRVALNLGETA